MLDKLRQFLEDLREILQELVETSWEMTKGFAFLFIRYVAMLLLLIGLGFANTSYWVTDVHPFFKEALAMIGVNFTYSAYDTQHTVAELLGISIIVWLIACLVDAIRNLVKEFKEGRQ